MMLQAYLDKLERIETFRLTGTVTELIGLLTTPGDIRRCPACRWPLDSACRCPKCFDRLCVDCGKPTGSYFIMRCGTCGHAFKDDEATVKP